VTVHKEQYKLFHIVVGVTLVGSGDTSDDVPLRKVVRCPMDSTLNVCAAARLRYQFIGNGLLLLSDRNENEKLCVSYQPGSSTCGLCQVIGCTDIEVWFFTDNQRIHPDARLNRCIDRMPDR
jgi:hypothetical protein